ncbi:hypothetical protein [Paenibacillus sp. FSL H8-0259]|uniref:hypothetical protein n=1 Tax=Paenibacillus sp. FSL H8-0259 TaxID=1920423 RepID=UPI0021162BEB|nr:hypothetical protein [Paenibacillus sp. FSL H8-0259]
MRPSILKSLNPEIIIEMIEMAYRFEEWDKMLDAAGILYSYAQCVYEERQYHKAKKLPVPLLGTARPLVYYFGFSHLMQGIAFQKQEKYGEARETIYRYAELGWMEDLGLEGLAIAEEFRGLARANLIWWRFCPEKQNFWRSIPGSCRIIQRSCCQVSV